MGERFTNITRSGALRNLIVLPGAGRGMRDGRDYLRPGRQQNHLKYQSTPKGKQKCDGCTLFVPGKTASANGTCKVISGPISPNGWCIAFAQKHA